MKFDNNKSIKKTAQLSFLLLIGVAFAYFLKIMHFISPTLFLVFGGIAFLSVLLILVNLYHFGYESFRHKLHFHNRKIILFRFYLKQKNVNIEKENLKRYRIKNRLIFNTLTLYVSASEKKEKLKKITVNMSFLSQKKINLLKESLDKVLNSNTVTA